MGRKRIIPDNEIELAQKEIEAANEKLKLAKKKLAEAVQRAQEKHLQNLQKLYVRLNLGSIPFEKIEAKLTELAEAELGHQSAQGQVANNAEKSSMANHSQNLAH